MWARNIELMLGMWLVLSPFIFRFPAERVDLWWRDLAVGTVVIVVSLLCYVRGLKRLHLVTLLLSVWLMVNGWLGTRGEASPAAYQNHLIVGMLLAMLAICPSDAALPPGFRREVATDGE